MVILAKYDNGFALEIDMGSVWLPVEISADEAAAILDGGFTSTPAPSVREALGTHLVDCWELG